MALGFWSFVSLIQISDFRNKVIWLTSPKECWCLCYWGIKETISMWYFSGEFIKYFSLTFFFELAYYYKMTIEMRMHTSSERRSQVRCRFRKETVSRMQKCKHQIWCSWGWKHVLFLKTRFENMQNIKDIWGRPEGTWLKCCEENKPQRWGN